MPATDLRPSWLDFKLGFRMLARYPGLTIVGGFAMAFAIWIGAATFELVTQVTHPSLGLPEGDRIVGLRVWDAQRNRANPVSAHDYLAWRGELKSVEDLGAYRGTQRNLILGEGRAEPIPVIEISASAFRVTRVPPLLGRALVAADEQPGAPPVAVIGYDLWQSRFEGDPAVVGRTVRLGRSQPTIVGVMPDGYEFPSSYDFWVPLTLDAATYGRREGPSLRAFARLAPGVSLEEAQAELTAIGERMAAEFPDTHEHLRPQVLPYAKSILDLSTGQSAGVFSLNIPVVMLLLLICANVALLMFARAATRESEMAIRTALGASRGRIITQLFAEALVLGSVAAVVGLALAGEGLRAVMAIIEAEMLDGNKLPFWFSASLSPTTVAYAIVLTLLAAVIAGVVPALKVTRGMGSRLQQGSAGAGGLQFGGIWTFVIIAQVAVTVAFPIIALDVRSSAVELKTVDVNFPAEQFLSTRLEIDREPQPGGGADTSVAAFRARYEATFEELKERLLADPSVAAVTYADRMPRMYHPHRLIQVDEGGAAPLNPNWPAGYRVSNASVDPDFFNALGTPIRMGRAFHAGDADADAGAPGDIDAGGGSVIVNESFVRIVLGGRNPIGRRIRYVHLEEWEAMRPGMESAPWYEIVGVAPDMATAQKEDPKNAAIYHPMPPRGAYPGQLAVRVKGSPDAFVPRLRAIAAATDPTLRLYDVERLDQVNLSELEFLEFWFEILALVSGVALVLSLAGIYAVMAFTVARRTREIGIRVALGASQARVVAAIFRRPVIHVALGVLAGVGIIVGITLLASGGRVSPRIVLPFTGYALLMMAVCMLACIVPTRRALRVEPTEALRADG